MSGELASHSLPFFPPEPLVKRAPRLDFEGLDLATRFLNYEAKKRITAKESIKHQYFQTLGPGIQNLSDGELI